MKINLKIIPIICLLSIKLAAQTKDTLFVYDMPHEILVQDKKAVLNRSLSFKSRELLHKELDWFLSKVDHKILSDSISLSNSIFNNEFSSIFQKITSAMPLSKIQISDTLRKFISKNNINKMIVLKNKGTTSTYSDFALNSLSSRVFTSLSGIPTITIKAYTSLYCFVIENNKIVHYAKASRNQEPLNTTTKDIMIAKVIRKYLKKRKINTN